MNDKHERIRAMNADGFSLRQISKACVCSYLTIHKALLPEDERGPESKYAAKGMPDDFAARARLLTFREAAHEFGVSGNTLTKWALKSGAKFAGGVRPVPADFEARYLVTVKRDLERHYQASYATVKRWGMKMTPAVRAEHDRLVKAAIGEAVVRRWAVINAGKPPKPAKTAQPQRLARMGKPMAGLIPEAKADVVSMAMRHLMPTYSPVCRAEVLYSNNAAKRLVAGQFKVGRMTMNETELMALAAKRGFTVSAGFAG